MNLEGLGFHFTNGGPIITGDKIPLEFCLYSITYINAYIQIESEFCVLTGMLSLAISFQTETQSKGTLCQEHLP